MDKWMDGMNQDEAQKSINEVLFHVTPSPVQRYHPQLPCDQGHLDTMSSYPIDASGGGIEVPTLKLTM